MAAPNLLLAEVAGAIARRVGRPLLAHQAVRNVLALSVTRIVEFDQPLAALAAQLAADLGLRGCDAAYVAVAQHLASPLVTWDEDQRRRASIVVPAYTPDTYPT